MSRRKSSQTPLATVGVNGLQDAHYIPPWVDMSIVGVAGSSGSGKTSLAVEVIRSLDLPWVIILSIDSFYKTLSPEENRLAHMNEWDLDSPGSIDFDLLVEKLKELKQGKRVDMPVYSFAQHQRLEETVSLYSPHVIILEGILALHDPRILELLDLKVYVEADADLCLSRRIIRDVEERGRTIEGTIKQWFRYVKPVYQRHVEPQRHVADLIVPRGMQNKVAISMIVTQIRQSLKQKSLLHNAMLEKLGEQVEYLPLAATVHRLEYKPQIRGIMTILSNTTTDGEEYCFYLDRLAALLVEKALDHHKVIPQEVLTPTNQVYAGLNSGGIVSAVVILRGGASLETGLKRTIPDCLTGRILIQTNIRTAEPELHYLKLLPAISTHETVLLLDSQMSSGGAALMAVRILIDHGVAEDKIVFVTFRAGRRGLNRLTKVFPGVKVVTSAVGEDHERRWIEDRYFGC